MAVVNAHIAESIAGVSTIRDYAIQPQVKYLYFWGVNMTELVQISAAK
jgi:hypothetical protein